MALRFLNSGYFAGKVGIGIENPGASLEIGNLIADAAGFIISSPGSEVNVNFSFIIGDTSLGLHSKNLVIKGSSGSSDIAFSPSSTYPGLMVLDGSAGNVGIGTTSPGAKLDVAAVTNAVVRLTSTGNGLGADTALGSLQFYGNDASVPGAGIKSSIVAKTEAALGDDSNLIFSTSDGTTNNVERMRITSTGNVGIGTTSPAAGLQVAKGGTTIPTAGSSTASAVFGNSTSDDNYGVAIGANSSGVGYISSQRTDGTATTYSLAIQPNGGNVGIGVTGPVSAIHAYHATTNVIGTFESGDTNSYINIKDSNSGTYGVLLGTTGDNFIVSPNNAEAMRILANGNVGIGTTSPGYKLEVESSTTPLHLNRTGGATALIGLDINGTTRGLLGATTTAAFVSYSTAAAALVTVANTGGVQFNTYGAGTLVTDASGNITVSSGGGAGGPYLPLAGGTMTGSIDFVNNKDISMTDSAGAITRVMVLNTSNTMYIGPVDTYAGGSILYGVAAGVSFQRFFTGASERLRIGSNGNIAIGTTATSYRLQVEQDNDGNLLSRFHNTAANGQGLLIRAGNVSSANRILQLASENDTKVMTVNSNGRVGIGIVNPTEKLEVVGNIKITAALLSNQENTDVDTGTETVANVSITDYTAAFFDFVIKKTTNVRSGTVYACHDGTNVEFTETSTNDLGDTSDVTLSVDISGTNMRLLATVTSDDWSVKSLIRAI